MTEERILTAVERIDGAMTRIEAAAARPAAPPPAAGLGAALGAGLAAGLASDSELRVRHDMLRERVEAAVAELDGLMRNG